MSAMVERSEVAATVSSLAATACQELFAAYGVALAPEGRWTHETGDAFTSGIIGFVGARVRGSCLLAGDFESFASSCPKQDRVRDWVGELTNQLLGRLKRKFLGYGVEIALTTPVVLSGLCLRPLPRGALLPEVFSTGQGRIVLWVEVESLPGFEFGPEEPNPSAAEGDVFLF